MLAGQRYAFSRYLGQSQVIEGTIEYWIINRLNDTITVLALQDELYVEHGVFGRGDHATSRLLEGFRASVDAVLDARQIRRKRLQAVVAQAWRAPDYHYSRGRGSLWCPQR